MRSFPRFLIPGTILLTLLTGCQKEEIERYEAAREERAPLFVDNPTSRLLGAIVPHEDSTWFFKLAGPAKTVEDLREPYLKFLRSVRFGAAAKPIQWTLPDGWTEEPGQEMRYATLKVGPADVRLDLIVTRLGREGEASSILANVNRWRKLDLGLTRPLHEADLPQAVKKEEMQGVTFTLVDLGGFTPARAAMPRPGGGPVREAPTSLKYDTPEGWRPVSGDTGFVRAEAAFRIVDGIQTADVTMTIAGGNVLDNVNRWREQVGLKGVSHEEVRQELRKVSVDGLPGDYADLTGPINGGQRILGVIVPQGNTTWFIKMRGPSALVAREQAAFEKFVASIRFAAR